MALTASVSEVKKRSGLRTLAVTIAASAAVSCSRLPQQQTETNPSLVPLRRVPGEGCRSFERYRFVADLDFDGTQDLALSYDTGLFGNAFGHFTISRGNADGTFAEIGTVPAHPLAVSLTRGRKGEGILATYLRGGGGSGMLVWYSIAEAGITEIGKKEIFPGDDARPEGRAEYARVFNNTDCLKPQISMTRNGKVTWADYYPWAFREPQD